MFGETPFQPETVLAPADLVAPAPAVDYGPIVAFAPAPLPALLPYDVYGAVQIPTASGLPFVPVSKLWVGQATPPVSDPALAVILDFLATFLVTDGNAKAAWAPVAGPSMPVLRRIYAHNPREVVFSTEDAPALYLWRDSSKQQWDADDWGRDHSVLKGLWLYPLAAQENQRAREPYINALAKLIKVGIERGRTPGWVQPADPDPQAASQGSLFWTFAGFDDLSFDSWRTAYIQDPDGSRYPAIELTFSMTELWIWGLGRYSPATNLYDQITNPDTGRPVVGGWLGS